MPGSVYVLYSDDYKHLNQVHRFTKPPTEKVLQEYVEGTLELIPEFDTILINGNVYPCLALAKDTFEALQDRAKINTWANGFWHDSLTHKYGLHMGSGFAIRGNVVILVGDQEFLDAL